MEMTSKLTGERIKQFLTEGKRFDGRAPVEYRDLIIEKNISINAEGSVRVKLGKTEVLVGVKMAVGEPYPDSQDEGNLMVTVELLPLSSPRVELGPPKFDSIEIGRITDRGIRESKYIQTKELCIEEGKKVWTVFVDVYSINDDGNLMDAAAIGAVAALQVSKIPKYDKETGKVLFGEWTEKNIPLSKKVPITITVHKVGDKFLVDPTREEEDVSETRVTVGMTEGGIISSMQKGESKALTVEQIKEVLDVAEKAYKDLHAKIEKSLR